MGIKNRIKGVQFGAVNGERIAKCLMCTPLPQHNIADAQVWPNVGSSVNKTVGSDEENR